MDNYEKALLRKKISRLVHRRALEDKRIVIFGASLFSKDVKNCLSEYGFAPVALIDNDVRKIGTECMGLRVQKPEDTLLPFDPAVAVLMFSDSFYREMTLQLSRMGYAEKRHIHVLNSMRDESLPVVAHELARVARGLWTYRRLMRRAPNATMFIAPYIGTGDIYLVGLFFTEYLRRNGVKEYIFIVVGTACAKVAEMFGIKNVTVSETKITDDIINCRRFLRADWPLVVLNDGWLREPLQWLRGYKGLHFEKMFRRFVFDFDDDVPHGPSPRRGKAADVDALFEKYSLCKGGTVVLSPYSNTLFELPDDFWEEVAAHFTGRGCTVCTNCAAPNEKPVKGTTAVFFPLGLAIDFLDAAGFFIGIRSGLCDIISSSCCGKIILYEKDGFFYKCSPYEYFSLAGMGLCDDAAELEYRSDFREDAIRKIYDVFDPEIRIVKASEEMNGGTYMNDMPVFYLKINTNNDFALKCFWHWVDIVRAYGADFYVVCDNEALKSTVCDGAGYNIKFIPSRTEAKDLLCELLLPNCLRTGAALLTPFIHAKESGFACFYNIDADDTVLLCDAQVCAKALRSAARYAEENNTDCLSLDMHSVFSDLSYKHWSFGVTYTKMNVDYIGLLERSKELTAELTQNNLIQYGNLDELFTNMGWHKSLLKINIFYIENMYFRHENREMHLWKQQRLILKHNGIRHILRFGKSAIQPGIPIPETYIKADAGITEEECLLFMENNKTLSTFEEMGFSDRRRLKFRDQLAQTFALFRDNINTPVYLFGGYNYFLSMTGAYEYLTGFDLFDETEGFIDNNPAKWGKTWGGYPIFSPHSIKKDALIIITGFPSGIQIEQQLIDMGYIHNYNYILSHEFECICKKYIYSQTRQFQNIHKGERCFIIGNGPSLTPEDLETLNKNGEIAFASNNFLKVFAQTSFRPKYYFLADPIMQENEDVLFSESEIIVFADVNYRNYRVKSDNIYFFEQSRWTFYDDYPYKPMFSDDIALLYAAGTISYCMLQVAVNMGFSEIYLIGMDHTFRTLVSHDGNVIINDDVQPHFYKNEKRLPVTYTKEIAEAAYSHARDYCKNKGVNICNATRGGKSEIFEHVDFDGLFKAENSNPCSAFAQRGSCAF